MKETKEFSPSEVAYIKDIIKRKLNLDFSELLAAYKRNSEFFASKSNNSAEKGLVSEIVYEGNLQLGANAGFDQIVIEGASSLATSLKLL